MEVNCKNEENNVKIEENEAKTVTTTSTKEEHSKKEESTYCWNLGFIWF